ncbi:hypothetical protein JCM17823_03980 [Halorubrum gandharaense]
MAETSFTDTIVPSDEMVSDRITRRQALAGTGAVLGGGVLAAGVTASSTDALSFGGDWHEAETPTTEQLHDVVHAEAGAVAAGEEGVVLRREGGEWRTVTEEGPSGDGNDLFAAGVSDDGERVWVAGASGAVGAYDGSGAGENYSEFEDYTGNVNAVAVAGDAGAETVLLVDDAGVAHRSEDGGETWSSTTPGSGSTLPAVDFHEGTDGHAVDTDQTAFAVHEGTFETIGIEDEDDAFYGVSSNAPDDAWVVGERGFAGRYDGDSWTVDDLGDVELRDVDAADEGYAVGSGGTVFAYDGTWHEGDSPTDEDLYAVATGDGGVLGIGADAELAVGDSGTVIERD